MSPTDFQLQGTDLIPSPSLIFYQELLEENISAAISMAGGAQRLWPHIKTHKSADVTRLMMAKGVSRFKCATLAEAQMLADCKAPHILLAYPLVGPNISLFLALRTAYPESHFYAIGDDGGSLLALSEAAQRQGQQVSVLLDINVGMDRTGVSPADAPALYAACARMPGLMVCGLHAYDGHHHQEDFARRCEQVRHSQMELDSAISQIRDQGLPCELLVLAGTPSFPCHALHGEGFLSPGTAFLMDHGYDSRHPDLPFTPAAALFTRVISHPAENLFTLDLGSKAIAADPRGQRGIILGLPQAEPILQSEEHWVWRLAADENTPLPAIGQALYVIPTHICPTCALHEAALVAKDHRIVDAWPITARNRKINL